MKLAFLSGHLSNGGAERVISNFSLLAPEGNKPHLIIYEDKIDYDFQGKIHCANIHRSSSLGHKAFNLLRRINYVKNIKKREQFSHVISFLENPNVVNLLTRSGEKTIISVRNNLSKNYDYRGVTGKLYKQYSGRFYQKADLVISLSEGVRKDLIQHHGLREDQVLTLYNPYNIPKIQEHACEPLPEVLQEIYKYPVLCAVGRLNYQKGFDCLIRILANLVERDSDIKLLILGSGNRLAELIALATEKGLSCYVGAPDKNIVKTHQIFFIERLQNPFPAMRMASSFCFPSLWEGYGNALAEAVIAGAKVFASDCQYGPREIIAPATQYFSNDTPLRTDRGWLLPSMDKPDFKRLELTSEELCWADCLWQELKAGNTKREIPPIASLEQFDSNILMPSWWKSLTSL